MPNLPHFYHTPNEPSSRSICKINNDWSGQNIPSISKEASRRNVEQQGDFRGKHLHTHHVSTYLPTPRNEAKNSQITNTPTTEMCNSEIENREHHIDPRRKSKSGEAESPHNRI